MKHFLPLALLALVCSTPASSASQDEIRKLESAGEVARAKAMLAQAAQTRKTDVVALTDYAQFLERYGDPEARTAYMNLLEALRAAGQNERASAVARRLAHLDLLAGDAGAASRNMLEYAALTGKRLEVAHAPGAAEREWPAAHIPGPLRSFARMAAIPSDLGKDEVLPALARNIFTSGYSASASKEALEPTEYLKLIKRYLSQARELQVLAGEDKVIRVPQCEAANVPELLRILGYRMRGGCGSELVLETVNASRAFLTTDSGFPLNELEQSLRAGRPFTHDFSPTAVPVIFGPEYWTKNLKEAPEFVDALISDPAMCRLYLGLAKLDPETADAIQSGIPFQRLRIYAHVLDFFGGMFETRGGKVVVPGGSRSAGAWADLVGASPNDPATFFEKLISKDDGWLAGFYDALARTNGLLSAYLTEPSRLKRFYTSVRGRVTTPGPARPIFRSNADLLMLVTRLQLDAAGRPKIPGDLEVWKRLFTVDPQKHFDSRQLQRAAVAWKEPDDLMEVLFGLSRKAIDNQPLRIFMAISDIDRNRRTPLEPATVERLARDYAEFGSQYAIFTETRALTDASILAYLDVAQAMSKMGDRTLLGEAAGAYQSLVGIWRILARERVIPERAADEAFGSLARSFMGVRNARDLFDAGRRGTEALLAAASRQKSAGGPHGQMLDLLAGPPSAADPETRQEDRQNIQRILNVQRMLSLDDIFRLADHLESVAEGGTLDPKLVNTISARVSETELPRAPLTSAERNAQGVGSLVERRIEAQRKLNLRASIEKASGDPEKIRAVRGLLAPLLRDTLLAFNYAYYAPPGGQLLLTNPLFVRSHDFVGQDMIKRTWRVTDVHSTGWPSNGGGRLAGSLSALPYALAVAEQNFLVPTQTQALIWGDLAPHMLMSAKLPRWWHVTPSQMHWVGLHLRYARELLAESAFDPAVRAQTEQALDRFASPARSSAVSRLLARGEVKEATELVTPSEMFALSRELSAEGQFGDSCLLAEMRRLEAAFPETINYNAISRAFGTPKPTLVNSYQPELLYLRTFPTLMGYSSRMLAESWESNTLYWAALADELNLPPARLSQRIPEWTQKLVERIFASNLDDWPAVLKSLRSVGDEERAQHRAAGKTTPELQGFLNR